MTKSKIEWTDRVWNPTTGCTKASTGCKHCYAERMSKRLAGRCGYPADDPFRVTLHRDRIDQPLRWRKPSKVFVCSMGDMFHASVPESFVEAVFHTMARCPQHTFQVLTKRAGRMADILDSFCRRRISWREGCTGRIPSNIWLGVSVEDQRTADYRIPYLLSTPAAVRFVSCEPLLDFVDLRHLHFDGLVEIDSLTGDHGLGRPLRCRSSHQIDWVIAGGESGPGARPCHPAWVRALRDQCAETSVPFLFKQWGEWKPVNHAPDAVIRHVEPDGQGGQFYARLGKKAAGRELDGRIHDEFPHVG